MICSTTLIMPTTASLLTTMCHSSIYGRALAYSQSFQALAHIIAPVAFGALYDSVNHNIPFFICAGSSLVAGVCIAAVPMPDLSCSTGATNILSPGGRTVSQGSITTQDEINANIDTLERQMSAKGFCERLEE